VTDLAKLKEAVGRYREYSKGPADEDKGARGIRLFRCAATASDIGQWLLDPSPISVESLQGMGFAEFGNKIETSDWLRLGVVNAYRVGQAGWTFFLYDQPANFANPQPHTVGQLLFLLLSLEKESS
jgi:hypothetical protein